MNALVLLRGIKFLDRHVATMASLRRTEST